MQIIVVSSWNGVAHLGHSRQLGPDTSLLQEPFLCSLDVQQHLAPTHYLAVATPAHSCDNSNNEPWGAKLPLLEYRCPGKKSATKPDLSTLILLQPSSLHFA